MSAREINVSTINLEGGGGGEPAKLQSKTIVVEENKTETVSPDSGFDGLSDVTVEVNVPINDGINMNNNIKFKGSLFTEIDSLNTYNWNNVTDMSDLFAICPRLVSVPQIDTSNVTNMDRAFTNCIALVSVGFDNLQNLETMNDAFYRCSHLKSFPDIPVGKLTALNSAFAGCTRLVSIGLLDFHNVTASNNFLASCTALENLGGFKDASVNLYITSTKLTIESLLNVINNLKDLTGATSKTLSVGETNLAKLTDEQKAVATNKNWVLA